MVDVRFDSFFLLAENFPDALDWPSLPREWCTVDCMLGYDADIIPVVFSMVLQ